MVILLVFRFTIQLASNTIPMYLGIPPEALPNSIRFVISVIKSTEPAWTSAVQKCIYLLPRLASGRALQDTVPGSDSRSWLRTRSSGHQVSWDRRILPNEVLEVEAGDVFLKGDAWDASRSREYRSLLWVGHEGSIFVFSTVDLFVQLK